tara:strand:+ start:92 stop:1621 length:1530 start_codon:yes stop_codon:yes gene_type:complete
MSRKSFVYDKNTVHDFYTRLAKSEDEKKNSLIFSEKELENPLVYDLLNDLKPYSALELATIFHQLTLEQLRSTDPQRVNLRVNRHLLPNPKDLSSFRDIEDTKTIIELFVNSILKIRIDPDDNNQAEVPEMYREEEEEAKLIRDFDSAYQGDRFLNWFWHTSGKNDLDRRAYLYGVLGEDRIGMVNAALRKVLRDVNTPWYITTVFPECDFLMSVLSQKHTEREQKRQIEETDLHNHEAESHSFSTDPNHSGFSLDRSQAQHSTPVSEPKGPLAILYDLILAKKYDEILELFMPSSEFEVSLHLKKETQVKVYDSVRDQVLLLMNAPTLEENDRNTLLASSVFELARVFYMIKDHPELARPFSATVDNLTFNDTHRAIARAVVKQQKDDGKLGLLPDKKTESKATSKYCTKCNKQGHTTSEHVSNFKGSGMRDRGGSYRPHFRNSYQNYGYQRYNNGYRYDSSRSYDYGKYDEPYRSRNEYQGRHEYRDRKRDRSRSRSRGRRRGDGKK